MIPRQRPPQTAQHAASAQLRDLAAHATVLVVDDEPGIRELLSVMLEVEGHRVVQAADGAEALALVAQHSPDLITLDVMMPGMDGWQVAERLDAEAGTAAIPRIMISGMPLGALQAAPGARRAAAVLSKPFDFAELTRLVTELLAPPVLPQQRGSTADASPEGVLSRPS